MVKKCKVLLYNPGSNILAFIYDNKKIQITTNVKLNKNIEFVYIKNTNGEYMVVEKDEITTIKNKDVQVKDEDVKK